MVPWKVLESIPTPEGALQLRQRGEREFLITIDGRVLMTSSERSSEEAVATLACQQLTDRPAPRVLIGGLGMAYTVRAALDALPRKAQVTVAELTPQVETWCRGPLAPLTRGATLDRRVRVVIRDVARVIEEARPGSFDAIVLDLYEGPHAAAKRLNDPFYGRVALERSYASLSPGGVLAIWSEEVNAIFKKRMIDAGFATSVHHPGGSRAYVVYLGRRDAPPERRDRGRGGKPAATKPASKPASKRRL
ncbi:MAG: spermidine synthase [Myxococcota bacterium]|nr:spermidine synthase [Myxococcota bacterium]